jgi:nucleoside-triphosphatase THEP1
MIFILTGAIHSGKTSFVEKIVRELKEEKVQIRGFLSKVVMRGNEIVGYDLSDLEDDCPIPSIRKKGREEWQRIGSYFFVPDALDRAKSLILKSQKTGLLVVDEIGPLELEGQGFWPALKQVIIKPSLNLLLVVRRNMLEDVLKLVAPAEIKVYNLENQKTVSRLVDEIKNKII